MPPVKDFTNAAIGKLREKCDKLMEHNHTVTDKLIDLLNETERTVIGGARRQYTSIEQPARRKEDDA